MIGKNLKYLRNKNKLSQQALSDILDIPRTTLGDYERTKTEPNIAMLIKMADHFDVKVDDLISADLSLSEYEVMKNKVMRVLAITVNEDNEGNIELVDSKAEAGYLDSYQNPEFIKELPRIQFPNIPWGTYRGFEIQGDSMLPIESGSIIIASYIENLNEIKDDRTYIVISSNDGLVYKRVKKDNENKQFVLSSDNETYLPYKLDFEEVKEMWQYYAHLSFSDAKASGGVLVDARINEIQKKLTELHQKFA